MGCRYRGGGSRFFLSELPDGGGSGPDPTPPAEVNLERSKILVSDVEVGHGNACKTIIENLNPTAEVDLYIGSFQAGVQYALDSGYAVISRSTTGLEDYDNTAGLEDYDNTAGLDMSDNGGIAVHAHGSNNYVELNDYSSIQSIISVRNITGSYGDGIEFTLIEYTNESYTTAYMAGKMGYYAHQYDTSYVFIRSVLRATASSGGTWQDTVGYGAPDWSAVEDSLISLSP